MGALWQKIKYRFDLFLVGFPYGLRGKVESVEQDGGKYTAWDKLRYRLYVGEKLEGGAGNG